MIEAMKEIGVDTSTQKSKELSDEMIRNSNHIVNMGCMVISTFNNLFKL
jgi:protein-tyrosine-phosphatase